MKRVFLVVLATVLFFATSFAQKGNNVIGGGADLGLPMGDFGDHFKTGFGIYGKGMFGVGKAGQVTFTAGYSSFKESGDWADFTTTLNIVPLLIGYRHNFNGLFVEPQIGYSIIGAKINSAEEGIFTESDGAFTCAASIGYVFNKQVEVSARYQTGGKQGVNLGLFGLRLGYNFSLGGSKK
jgi:hypothetical protein